MNCILFKYKLQYGTKIKIWIFTVIKFKVSTLNLLNKFRAIKKINEKIYEEIKYLHNKYYDNANDYVMLNGKGKDGDRCNIQIIWIAKYRIFNSNYLNTNHVHSLLK